MRNYLKTINGRGGNKCRALPSAELQDGALEARLSPDPVPHPWAFTGSPSHSWCMWHKGRKATSEDCFEGRPHCPETLLWRWGLLEQVSLSSCPEAAHFFPSFILKDNFNLSSLQSKKAELQQVSSLQADPAPCLAACASITRPCAATWTCRSFIYSVADHSSAAPEVGVNAQELIQSEGLQRIPAPELGLCQKKIQHYKGEMHPLLPAHHHTAPQLFSRTPTVTSTKQTPNSSHTDSPSFAQCSWSTRPPKQGKSSARESN